MGQNSGKCQRQVKWHPSSLLSCFASMRMSLVLISEHPKSFLFFISTNGKDFHIY